MNPILVDQFGRGMGGYSDTYDAVKFSYDREWRPTITDDSAKNYPTWTRRQMMSLARNAYANVGFIKGAIDDIGLYSVGVGIGMKSAAPDKSVRVQFDEAWNDYVQTPSVDALGRFNLATLLKLYVQAILTDCDCGAIFVEDESTGRAQIQSIRAHRIEDCGVGDSVDGVIPDGIGRAIKYRINVGKSSGDKNFVEIPAEQFCLLFDPECTDELRGKTALHHALNKIQDVKEILQAETVAVKDNAKISFAVKTAMGTGGGGTRQAMFGKTENIKDSDGKTLYTVEAMRRGSIPRLLPGEDLWSHESSRPSSTFTGFLDYHDADVAVGLGLPLAFIRAYKDSGGPAQRFIMAKAQRKFEWIQTQILIPFLRKFRFVWAAAEIRRGALPDVDGWWKVTPQLPSKATIDVGREAQQNREDMRFGSRSLEEDAAERGKSADEIQDERKHVAIGAFARAVEVQTEVKKLTGVDITLAEAMQHIAMLTPNGNTPVPDENKKEEEPK